MIFGETQRQKHIRLTEYLVEANSHEALQFWRDWSIQAGRNPKYAPVNTGERISWEQVGTGMWEQVGKVDGRPICVNIFWNWLNGHLIGFWDATSELVDYKMVKEWLDTTFSGIERTDSMNFHAAFSIIKPKATNEC